MKIRKEVQAIIFDRQEEEKILLIKRYTPVELTYFWRFVKGGVEEDETEKEAIKREIKEEVGLQNTQVKEKVHDYKYVFPDDVEHQVSVYLVKGDMREKIIVSDDGVHRIIDAKWVSIDEAKKMLHFDNEKKSLRKVYG